MNNRLNATGTAQFTIYIIKLFEKVYFIVMHIDFQVSTLYQHNSNSPMYLNSFTHGIIEPSKASSEAQGDLCRAKTRIAAHFDTLKCNKTSSTRQTMTGKNEQDFAWLRQTELKLKCHQHISLH